ncbi:MAG: DegT/DnrJ/EryC1/StrS family aminotransferase [Chthonomonadales bacterium]
MRERLAVDGGTPVFPEGLPSAGGGPGVTLMNEEEIAAVAAVLRSGKLFRFTEGSQVRAFEQEAAEWLGVRHALMVNSGTSALVCALVGAGIGPGDEVIVPAYTYIATAAAVVAVGAVPVIAEIDTSLGLDPADVERKITPHTRAILPVYMQGVPARIGAITAVAKRHRIAVIEDACQCIGGTYRGKPVGTFGVAGAWSLNFFKIISAGEGGLVFTDDYRVYERACFASDPALPMWMKDSIAQEGWDTPPFSFQCYRPSEMLGAVARVQLSRLNAILEHTRNLKRTFVAALEEPRGYRLQHVDDPDGDCGISAAILVDDAGLAARYADALTAEGLPCGTAHNEGFPDRHIYRYWDSILDKSAHHKNASPWAHPAYHGSVEYSRDMCPRTLDLLSRAIRFGFNMRMSADHARRMAHAVNKVDAALGGLQ